MKGTCTIIGSQTFTRVISYPKNSEIVCMYVESFLDSNNFYGELLDYANDDNYSNFRKI